MTILVTGGAGYIGSHMVHELLDTGEIVVVLDNLQSGFRFLIPSSVPFISGNAGDRDLVTRVITQYNVTAIIHFAGSIVATDPMRAPFEYYHNNTATTCNLLDVAVRAGVQHFIFSSSAAIYGSFDHAPVREDAPTKPISPYGASKLMAEIILHDVGKAHGLRFVVLRHFNVAGADPKGRTGQSNPAATHLIKIASEAALGKRAKLDVFGDDYPTPDGTCVRDYIHVSDLARSHSAALAYLRRGGVSTTFNCGCGRGVSVIEVIEALRRVSRCDFPVEIKGRRAGDPACLVADVERIRRTLDWHPQFQELDTIVAHAFAWERRLPGKAESAQA
jgi:UDP-glucose 4-epimerase